MKSLLYGVLLSLLCGFAAAGEVGVISVNQSELPLNMSIWQDFTQFEGVSVNFTYDSWLSGPDTIYFDSNSTQNVTFYVVVENATPAGLYEEGFFARTEWVDVNISEYFDEENNLTLYNTTLTDMFELERYYWTVNVSADDVAEYAEINESQRTYTYCDYSIPLNRSAQFSIHGSPDMQVVTVCQSGLLECPEYVQLDSSGNGVANINIYLWDNLTAGTYDSKVKIDLGLTDYFYYTYIFEITDCVNPPPASGALIEACQNLGVNSTVDEILACRLAMNQYDNELYQSLLDAAESRTINHTETVFVDNTTEVFVPVAELDDNTKYFFENIGAIQSDWKKLQSNFQNTETELKELKSSVGGVVDLNNALNANMKQEVMRTVENLSNRVVSSESELAKYRKGSIKYTTIVLLLGVLIVLFGGGYWFVWWRSSTFLRG